MLEISAERHVYSAYDGSSDVQMIIEEHMESKALLVHYADHFATFQRQDFFSAVANDTITPHQLGVFLIQDAHYLLALGNRLRELAQLAEDAEAKSILQQHSRDAENLPDVARRIVERDLGLPELAREVPRLPTRDYIDHQRRSVCNGIRDGILSILPCYLFYPYFVASIHSKAADSGLLQKCLQFISNEKQAHRWAEEILEVWNRTGLGEPSGETDAAFALSAEYEVALLAMAMQ